MNNWISVKEELPPLRQTVLLLRTIGRVQRMIVGYYFKENFWYDIDDLWDCPLMNITHWMLLPKLPKQENDDNES